MRTSALELDLASNANDRLRQWLKDTKWRCEAVHISRQKAMLIIIGSLIATLIPTMQFTTTIDAEEFGRLMKEYFKEYERRKANDEFATEGDD